MRSPILATLALATLLCCRTHRAEAGCTLPNQLTNGQTADASQVMQNFNAAVSCNAPGGQQYSIQLNAGNGSFAGLGPMSNGQLVIGSSGAEPVLGNLTAGPGISITNGNGTITIGQGTAPAQVAIVQSAFVRTPNVSPNYPATITLPSSPTPGDLLVAIGTGNPNNVNNNPGLEISGLFNYILNITVPNEQLMVGVHVVQSGDGTTWPGFVGGNGSDTFGIIEFSNAHSALVFVFPPNISGSSWSFLAGTQANSASVFIQESDSINPYASSSGVNILFNGTNDGGSHAAVISDVPNGSASNATINYQNAISQYNISGDLVVSP